MSAFLSPPDPGPGPGAPGAFAATRWTVVLAARGHSEESRQALSALCAAYYAPVVAFLRRDGGRTEDDARELAHGFFAGILAGGRFEAVDRERGKFRSYLLGALKHWLRDQWRAAQSARRGGQVEHVALRPVSETSAGCDPPSAGHSLADLAYDRQWALTVLERALEALGTEFEQSGKRAWFETLRPWLGGDPPARDQPVQSPAEVAAVLGMSPGALKVAIHRLRQRFRTRVKSEIAQTLGDSGGDVAAELEYLIRVLG
ncbi:MAG: sigma-70 family RNA polymerase sigma factor [Verrucomicrobiota bacterium]